MKILVIGNFLESSGWSEQCRNTILAMDAAGLEVIPRNITILNNQGEIPERIKELEKQSSKNPNVILYNTLPSLYEYHGNPHIIDNNEVGNEFFKKIPTGIRNVGFYVTESSNFLASGWQNKCNLMDDLINCCYWNKQVSKDSGIKKPIHIIPQAIDLDKSNKEYKIHPIKNHFKDEFIFYVIAEWGKRKNIETIIRAFHTEFRPTEQVQLVIKTNGPNLGSNPLQEIQNRVNNIKMELKLYRNIETYKKEVLVVGNASEEEIYSIHHSCDCYVSTSHAEAFNIPCAIAMSMGKIVCVPNYGGFLEYCSDKNSYLTGGYEDYVYSATDTLPDLYTGREKWFYPSIQDLRTNMRLIFENNIVRKKKIEQAKKDIQKLSFQSIGKQYKKVLG